MMGTYIADEEGPKVNLLICTSSFILLYTSPVFQTGLLTLTRQQQQQHHHHHEFHQRRPGPQPTSATNVHAC